MTFTVDAPEKDYLLVSRENLLAAWRALRLLALPGCCLGETSTLSIAQVGPEADTPSRLRARLEGGMGGAP